MIKPLPGFVLIEPIKETDKTTTGVYLPESSKDKPMKGTVIEVGENVYRNDSPLTAEVSKKDVVYYKKWGGDEIKADDGKEYVFVKFEDIMGVIE